MHDGKHRYKRPDRLPILTGDAFLRRRLSLDPHCYWCRRRVYHPRDRARVPAAQLSEVDYKRPAEEAGADERNCLLVCAECKLARGCMSPANFAARVQTFRGKPAEEERSE